MLPVLLQCLVLLSSVLEFRLDVFCNKPLRWIMGYIWQDRVSNRRLRRDNEMAPVTCIIQYHQLRLYGRTKLVSQWITSFIRLSPQEIILGGGGSKDDLGGHVLGSSTRPVASSWRCDECLPGVRHELAGSKWCAPVGVRPSMMMMISRIQL